MKPMKEKGKKIFSYLRLPLLCILAAVLGINIYMWNATRLTGNIVPMPFGVGAAVVLSGSMEPELSVGDLLLVAERDTYEVEDVVVYQDGGMSVTHRIISIDENEVITKGDANNTEDDPITPSHIKGEVVLAIPLVGYLVNILKSPIGMLLILALAVFLLESSFHGEKQRDKEALDEIRAEIERLKQEQNKK